MYTFLYFLPLHFPIFLFSNPGQHGISIYSHILRSTDIFHLHIHDAEEDRIPSPNHGCVHLDDYIDYSDAPVRQDFVAADMNVL